MSQNDDKVVKSKKWTCVVQKLLEKGTRASELEKERCHMR